MELVTCRSCGKSVQAFPGEDALKPLADECPDCGGTVFEDTNAGIAIDTQRE